MSAGAGQTHHESWTALEKSAAKGCRLCSFLIADRSPKEDLVHLKLYTGESPIVLRMGWARLHMSP